MAMSIKNAAPTTMPIIAPVVSDASGAPRPAVVEALLIVLADEMLMGYPEKSSPVRPRRVPAVGCC